MRGRRAQWQAPARAALRRMLRGPHRAVLRPAQAHVLLARLCASPHARARRGVSHSRRRAQPPHARWWECRLACSMAEPLRTLAEHPPRVRGSSAAGMGRGRCDSGFCWCDAGWHGVDCGERSPRPSLPSPSAAAAVREGGQGSSRATPLQLQQKLPSRANASPLRVYVYDMPAEFTTRMLQVLRPLLDRWSSRAWALLAATARDNPQSPPPLTASRRARTPRGSTARR